MYRLIEFLRRIYVVLLFFFIEAVAIYCYANSSVYTQAKILTRANSVVGGLHNSVYGIRHYFSLRSENEMLAERVAALETQLEAIHTAAATSSRSDSLALAEIDSLTAAGLTQYRFMTARIIANSTNKMRNFITLNRGRLHGVNANMGVITPDGVMVGRVTACSDRYSVVTSILNTDFRTSGKIAGDDRLGSIHWQGKSPYKVEMTELSKYAEFDVGDEVIGSGESHFFPPGMHIRIGTVESYELNEEQTAYSVVIRLAADISKLNNVILIENFDYDEISQLEESVEKGTYLNSMFPTQPEEEED